MQRPTGITVLAISILVIATFRFIISFLDMAIGSWLTAMAMSPGYIAPQYRAEVDAIGDLGFWIGLFGMIIAVVMLIAVRGLWSMSGWGWWLALFALARRAALEPDPDVPGHDHGAPHRGEPVRRGVPDLSAHAARPGGVQPCFRRRLSTGLKQAG